MLCSNANAQINALTETGKQVILYYDNTWKYAEDGSTERKDDTIKLNPNKFIKSDKATFGVKSGINKMGVYIDPKKWTFSSANDNGAAEFRFTAKTGDMYAMMINEKISLGLENLEDILLNNAKRGAYDAKVVFHEFRVVNNNKVLCVEIKGTVKSMKVIYFGYYYSDASGMTQLTSYTSESLFEGQKSEMETFLNGLVKVSNN